MHILLDYGANLAPRPIICAAADLLDHNGWSIRVTFCFLLSKLDIRTGLGLT